MFGILFAKKGLLEIDCRACHGTGYVSKEQMKRAVNGMVMRKNRIAEGKTLRVKAREMGIKPSELGDIENGILEMDGKSRG